MPRAATRAPAASALPVACPSGLLARSGRTTDCANPAGAARPGQPTHAFMTATRMHALPLHDTLSKASRALPKPAGAPSYSTMRRPAWRVSLSHRAAPRRCINCMHPHACTSAHVVAAAWPSGLHHQQHCTQLRMHAWYSCGPFSAGSPTGSGGLLTRVRTPPPCAAHRVHSPTARARHNIPWAPLHNRAEAHAPEEQTPKIAFPECAGERIQQTKRLRFREPPCERLRCMHELT